MNQEVKLLLLFFLSSVPPERAAGVSAVAAARVSSSETFSWCDHQGYQSRTLNNVGGVGAGRVSDDGHQPPPGGSTVRAACGRVVS